MSGRTRTRTAASAKSPAPEPADEENSRTISPARKEEDAAEATLRPQSLDDFVGQQATRENLAIFIQAARACWQASKRRWACRPRGRRCRATSSAISAICRRRPCCLFWHTCADAMPRARASPSASGPASRWNRSCSNKKRQPANRYPRNLTRSLTLSNESTRREKRQFEGAPRSDGRPLSSHSIGRTKWPMPLPRSFKSSPTEG